MKGKHDYFCGRVYGPPKGAGAWVGVFLCPVPILHPGRALDSNHSVVAGVGPGAIGGFERTAATLNEDRGAAFAAKFFIDWVVVTRIFHRPWNLLNYWRPFGEISGVHALTFENRLFAGLMLFIAVPFIWLGLAMTVKRLRDAGEPTWVAALFFAPVANLLFFLVLILKPSAKEARREEGVPWPGPRFLDSWVPETRAGSVLVSIAVTAVIGLGFTLLGTQVVATYGWGLFVGLPFCLGLFAVLMHSYREPRSYSECVLMAVLPVFLLGAILLLVAVEGVICILMAAPIALVM